jgi:cytochrome c biogenesis protein CcmG/thiol:disulfide interchange protein DsbE
MIRSLIPLFTLLFVALVFAIGLTKDPRSIPSELINQKFPSFSLSELNDAENIITEKDLLNKVSLVNVFGSWCAACITEHPFLMRISEKENINLIGINWRDDRTKAIGWLSYYGNPYDKIIYDDESTLAIQLGVTGAPESFIIDFEGQIRYKHVGIINKEIWDSDILPVIKRIKKT